MMSVESLTDTVEGATPMSSRNDLTEAAIVVFVSELMYEFQFIWYVCCKTRNALKTGRPSKVYIGSPL